MAINFQPYRSKNFLCFDVVGEAYNDAMNVSLQSSFAVPAEGTVSKIDIDSTFKQIFPQGCNLLSLTDAVSTDEGSMSIYAIAH